MVDLRKLFGSWRGSTAGPTPRPPSPARDERIALARRAGFGFHLAGPSFHQAELKRLPLDQELDATLEHELHNEHDPNAIRVTVRGLTVGHFHREDAERFVEWIGARGYAGRIFKAPAVVVRAPVEDVGTMLFANLSILSSPFRVDGDLDKQTKRGIDLLFRQAGTKCLAHMDREKGDPAAGVLDRLTAAGFFVRAPCDQCGKATGYALANAAWVAKFGTGEREARERPDLRPVSGW